MYTIFARAASAKKTDRTDMARPLAATKAIGKKRARKKRSQASRRVSGFVPVHVPE
jgi:putative ubiquitin-RnfH superfamily antitoxin RatB of RatAB toxin-antitoxin module